MEAAAESWGPEAARRWRRELEGRYAAWAQARGLTEVRTAYRHPEVLVGLPGYWRVGGARIAKAPSWLDHARVWARGGRPVLVTAEPYTPPDSWLPEVRELAHRHGLRVRVSPPERSLHNPARTWLLEMWGESGAK